MLDFACALYLGMRHGSDHVPPWRQLTSGRPAALSEPVAARLLGAKLATLIGCESAIIATSTLHLFWDLFGFLSETPISLYLDTDSYPIARWGAERAMARGTPLHCFPGHNSNLLRRLLLEDDCTCLRPVVVADGYSPGKGRIAPLGEYLRAVESRRGYIVIDDTQALGILGKTPRPSEPYGSGGGGTLQWSGIRSPSVIMIASLAKGFGVPMAVMAGPSTFIEAFKRQSQTRLHCSPPSMAMINAAEHALAVNMNSGEVLRRRLARSVIRFRNGIAGLGLTADGGLFPVQTLCTPTGWAAEAFFRHLTNRGIKVVPQRAGDNKGARLSFVISASHSPLEIDQLIQAVADAMVMIPTHRR